jgi:hypothetical protein
MTESNIISGVSDVSKSLIGALPAQFLMLLCINTIFIIGLLWYLDRGRAAEERVLVPMLTACIKEIPLEALPRVEGKQP